MCYYDLVYYAGCHHDVEGKTKKCSEYQRQKAAAKGSLFRSLFRNRHHCGTWKPIRLREESVCPDCAKHRKAKLAEVLKKRDEHLALREKEMWRTEVARREREDRKKKEEELRRRQQEKEARAPFTRGKSDRDVSKDQINPPWETAQRGVRTQWRVPSESGGQQPPNHYSRGPLQPSLRLVDSPILPQAYRPQNPVVLQSSRVQAKYRPQDNHYTQGKQPQQRPVPAGIQNDPLPQTLNTQRVVVNQSPRVKSSHPAIDRTSVSSGHLSRPHSSTHSRSRQQVPQQLRHSQQEPPPPVPRKDRRYKYPEYKPAPLNISKSKAPQREALRPTAPPNESRRNPPAAPHVRRPTGASSSSSTSGTRVPETTQVRAPAPKPSAVHRPKSDKKTKKQGSSHGHGGWLKQLVHPRSIEWVSIDAAAIERGEPRPR